MLECGGEIFHGRAHTKHATVISGNVLKRDHGRPDRFWTRMSQVYIPRAEPNDRFECRRGFGGQLVSHPEGQTGLADSTTAMESDNGVILILQAALKLRLQLDALDIAPRRWGKVAEHIRLHVKCLQPMRLARR